MTARIGRPAKHPLSQRAQAQGLTLADVAARAGMGRARLNNLLAGQDCPLEVARQLADILRANVHELGLEVIHPGNTSAVMRWCRRVITQKHTRPVALACEVSISTVQRWRLPEGSGPTKAQVAVIETVTGHPFADPAAVCATCGQEMP